MPPLHCLDALICPSRSRLHKSSRRCQTGRCQAAVSQRHISCVELRPYTHPTALTLDDTAYPDALRDLPFAPPVLFYAGNLEHLRDPCVAIVGARRCTQRARDIAENFARSLAAEQVSIVTAYGVDEAAHVAAPERAIAVLGQGLGGRLTGRPLIELICESGGLILSEFLLPPDIRFLSGIDHCRARRRYSRSRSHPTFR